MTAPETWELRSARYLAREAQEKVIRAGDTVVDATMGNGYDTVRLAELVGSEGHVFAFDVQPLAVMHTMQRLEDAGVKERCSLLCCSHAEMARYVPGPVRCVVFNLGWLPGGDKRITTRWPSTWTAVRAALRLLQPMGVCTICAYPGHAAGDEERRNLVTVLSGLRPQDYNVLHQRFLNAGEDAPECFIIQRQNSKTDRSPGIMR